jgi:hypothetical protein
MLLMRNRSFPATAFGGRSKCGYGLAMGAITLAFSSAPLLAANVTIDAANSLATVGNAAFGLHTSVYDNQNGNGNLPSRLIQSGVNTLRYSGGGYADIFHWSVSRPALGSGNGYGMTPWWGQTNNYGYMGSQTDFGNFVKLLSNAQCQAVITVDFGSGQKWDATHSKLIVPTTNASPQEAAAWVAYANANTNIYGTANDVTIGVDALGNDWKTAGYWAMVRATSPLGADDGYNFLRINHPSPVGIKYWEVGNETFGTGYYGGGNGYSVNYAVPYPYTNYVRTGNPLLSPAAYGQTVVAFSQLMKAVDPTIQVGAVVSTPPGDYSWDIYHNQRWIPQVLAQCAPNIDFVIAHWYSPIGNSNDGSTLLAQVGGTIPFMINGATAGLDSGTNSGLRDWINTYRPNDGTNVQIFITEFGYNIYTGSITNAINGTPVLGPVNALFTADCYSTWWSYGVANVDYLEMNATSFLGDSSSLTRGEVYYAVQMLSHLCRPGDSFVSAASDTSDLRAKAVLQQDGNFGILLINENRNSSQTVNVTVNNASLSSSGTAYQFGVANFSGTSEIPVSGPSSNSASGFGSSFSINVPAYTMVVLVIPTLATNTPPTLAPIAGQTVNAGQTVAFTASAMDTDQPPQNLTFNLLNAPTNATLGTSSGAFSWRPFVGQANTTNLISLKVTDSGNPNLSATQSFIVLVNPLAPTLASPVSWSNGQFVLQVSGQAGPDYAVLGSTNLTDWNTLFTTNSPAMPFEWVDTNAAALPNQFYRIEVGPPLP